MHEDIERNSCIEDGILSEEEDNPIRQTRIKKVCLDNQQGLQLMVVVWCEGRCLSEDSQIKLNIK